MTTRALLAVLCLAHSAAAQGQESSVTLALNSSTVHWGFFSKTIDPVLTIDSGTTLTVEMATHHACDDYDRMSEFILIVVVVAFLFCKTSSCSLSSCPCR